MTIAWPLVVFVLGFITFEATMAAIVMTVPDARQRSWTEDDKKRVHRIVLIAVLFWPIVITTYLVHQHFATTTALVYDAVLIALAVWLLTRARRARIRRRQVLEGHCPACHYDLRGGPDREQCPECGHRIHPLIREAARARPT